ncbi:MAG: hypothetical protein AB7D47_07660 [Desulfovibrio sp.]
MVHKKRVYAFISTIPKLLNLIFCMSFVGLIIKIFILNNIPSPHIAFFEIGKIVESILLSIVASYFFYLITVHVSYFNKNISRCVYVSGKIDDVYRRCRSIIDAFNKTAECSIDILNVNQDSLEQCLGEIDPNTNAPLMIPNNEGGVRYAIWQEFFIVHANHTIGSIDKLLDISITTELDENMVTTLRKIKECSFYNQLLLIARTRINNSEMKFLAKPINEYVSLVVELKHIKERYQKTWQVEQ